jgi:hypothetical protein
VVVLGERVRVWGVVKATATGVSEFVVVVLPNWPSLFKPQQSTPPKVSMAQVASYPTLAEATPERVPESLTPTTATGVSEFVGVLLPS